MGRFLVERYIPGAVDKTYAELGELLGAAFANEVGAIRYLGSIVVRGDDACLCLFEGPSASEVAAANKAAGATVDRVVPVLVLQPAGLDLWPATLREPDLA
ncbi:MAG TPA: nickel-binding protein [Actinomycetota bacterium]|nr:nickel-binding protein [Actinomycetota bacterium]